MKKLFICSLSFLHFLVFAIGIYAFEPTNPSEKALYDARLIPAPQTTKFGSGVVVFNECLSCTLVAPADVLNTAEQQNLVAETQTTFQEYFNAAVQVSMSTPSEVVENLQQDLDGDSDKAEFAEGISDVNFYAKRGASYILALPDSSMEENLSPEETTAKQNVLRGSLFIAGSDLEGFRNAFKTLRQLSETFADSESTQTSRFFVPESYIEDAPALSFRGLHLCWFPETNPTKIEQSIRIASYYKFNYIVLEFWGTFPFESNNMLTWSEFHTSKSEVRRLVQFGKKLGVQLIPQINLFGHASGSRVSVGKHVTLDFYPEYEPLFEPDGWTWNIYNPTTKRILTECVLELYEVFDSPEFFHIGCDEAYSAGSSFLARRKGAYADVLAEWLIYFHDLLRERNCRMAMWHDMLIEPDNYQGYVTGGNAKTRGLVDKLPKDILICDWQYGKPKEDEAWPTTSYFQSKGYDVISCPWRNLEGIKSLAQSAIQKNGFGILCTTWHMFYGADMRNILTTGAHSAWGTTYRGTSFNILESFNRHLRQASQGVKNKSYRTNGVNDWQVEKDPTGPLG
ncbi:MAG: family 20 glycosylhydrolase [Thermoguttaceae bacterium]|nr:family 20 glycosylhydrolase [Thermoguttaceae bacterium]